MGKLSLKKLDKLWELLTDIPINEKEEIDNDFFIWEKGTPREEIWHWFDNQIDGGIGKRYFN